MHLAMSHDLSSPRRRSFGAAACIAVVCLMLVIPAALHAQDGPVQPGSRKTESFDVTPGQLSKDQITKPAASSQPAPRQKRTQAQADALVAQLASGYRSACCPHQKMSDRGCPCYPFQIGMLTFLAIQGFAREEIDQFMVHGGPGASKQFQHLPDLSNEYAEWLRTIWMPSSREPLSGDFDRYFTIKFKVRGKEETYGWNHGWSELIREAPQEFGVYLMLLIAAVLVVVSFVTGAVILKRMRQDDAAVASTPAPPVTDAAREKLKAEVSRLDDED